MSAALFVSYAYFYQAGGWNQNAHFDLVRAIVEHGQLQIDEFAGNTGDTAHAGDHVYSNKAPGLAFTVAPAIAILRASLAFIGVDVGAPETVMWLSYAATLAGAAVPAALGAWCLLVWSGRLGANDTAATVTTLALGLGTPYWAYATILYSHALTAATLLAAALAADAIRDAQTPRAFGLAALVGLLAGWSVVTEYTSVPAAVTLAGLALWHARGFGRVQSTLVAAAIAIGAAGPAVALMAYNAAAFGSPFHLSYANVDNFALQRTGFYGLGLPNMRTALPLLFGRAHGLLPLAPVLLVAALGIWRLCAVRTTRAAGVAASVIVLGYLWVNASYAYWWGGWNYGPRYLGPALGFWSLGIAALWMAGRPLLRATIVAATIAGAACALMAVSTTPQPPDQYARPVSQLFWPLFRQGQLADNWESILDKDPGDFSQQLAVNAPRAAWNLGQLMGLQGLWSVVPLVLVWLGAARLWFRAEVATP